MHIPKWTLLLPLAAAVLAPPVLAQAEVDSRLAERLASAAPEELIPFYAVMRDHVRAQALAAEFPASRYTPDERRAIFIGRAKQAAAASQHELLAFLRSRPPGQVADVEPLWILNAVVAQARPAVLERVFEIAGVERVMLRVPSRVVSDLPAEPAPDPDPALGTTVTWSVDLIRAPEVWATGITGSGVVVAHFDTGACYNHPDLAGGTWINAGELPGNGQDDDGNGYVDDVRGYDFEQNASDPMDDHGHGTHTMGSVVGDGTSGTQTGVAPGAKVMIGKVLSFGSGDGTAVWEGYQYALENGADLVTASIGWVTGFHSKNRQDWREASDNVAYAGLILVFAAGNERGFIFPPESIRTPGDVPSVISVAATDDQDNMTWFSSDGPTEWGPSWLGEDTDGAYHDWEWSNGGLVKPDITGPGEDVESTIFCAGYGFNSGTSMATPHLAGVVALMLEANPLLTRDDILEIFAATSLDFGPLGKDNDFGWGRVDAFEAVSAAGAATPVEVTLSCDDTLVDPGDVVTFTARIENTSGSAKTRDYWIDVTRTDGSVVISGLYGPRTATLGAGQSKTVNIARSSPLNSGGTLLVTLKSGSYGVSVEDASTIAVTFR